MPTYDYICKNCNIEFEKFQSIKANPIIKCKNCGKNSLKRLIGLGSGAFVKDTPFPVQQKQEQKEKLAYKKKGRKKTKNRKLKESEIPCWRSREDGKVRTDILKNPKKYIETGDV